MWHYNYDAQKSRQNSKTKGQHVLLRKSIHDVSTDSVDDVRGGQSLFVQVFCRMEFRITTFLTTVYHLSSSGATDTYKYMLLPTPFRTPLRDFLLFHRFIVFVFKLTFLKSVFPLFFNPYDSPLDQGCYLILSISNKHTQDRGLIDRCVYWHSNI